MSLPLLFVLICIVAFVLAGVLSTTLLVAGSQLLSRGLEALVEISSIRH
jgi:hypothetical protein